jgi:hypothetical protein
LTTWTITYEFRGHLIEDHAVDIAEQAAYVHTNETDGTFTVGVRTKALTYDKAVRAAVTALDNIPTLTLVRNVGTVTGPHRITVERADAPSARPGLVSTAGAAEILGRSEARVRQMRGQLDFPLPLNVPGLRGEVYLAADIEAYRDQRPTPAVDPGRPRADDEAKVDTALGFIDRYPGLPLEQRLLIERALRSHGSRFVREKARFVRQIMAQHGTEIYRMHASSVGFGEAMRRVLELAGD